MVTLPASGFWSIRSLRESDRSDLLSFLEQNPLINAYLISRVLDEGVAGAGDMLQVSYDGVPLVVAALGSNVVMAANREVDPELLASGIRVVGEKIITRHLPLRAIISEADLVEILWDFVRAHYDPPTVLRLSQPVYVLDRDPESLPDLHQLRFSELRDLEILVPACAAMHREEVGIDPMERDAFGYRERVRELVWRRRSLIMFRERQLVFKCELSAVTPATIQLMGVWTAPAWRRRGLARLGMSEISGHILREGKSVTLFVNDFNAAAIALYESLGFRRIGQNRALIW
ncbi:MAG: GNAT family N-acetyltransferase [Thermoanaerobaculia bacterium]